MKKYAVVAMDEIIQGAATDFYTAASMNPVLGSADKFVAHVVVDNVSANGNITVQVEHSSDGRNWVPKNVNGGTPPTTVAEINAVGITAGVTNSDVRFTFSSDGSDTAPRPLLPLVRLRVRLTTTVTAHVKISVCGHDC